MQPIRTAVIGAGRWGRNLIRNIERCDNLHLIAICDRCPSQLTAFGRFEITNDSTALFRRDDVDAIVLATPPKTHFRLAEQTLLQGKHLLCEKPLALAAGECRQLATLAEARHLCLMVDCTPVYLDEIQAARRSISWRNVTSIRCVRTIARAAVFPDELIWSLAPHDLAVLKFWLGSLPTRWHRVDESPTLSRLTAVRECGMTIDLLIGQERHARREILVTGDSATFRFQQQQATPEPLQQVVSHFAQCVRHRREPLTPARAAAETAEILATVTAPRLGPRIPG